jgi:hypothetical protein
MEEIEHTPVSTLLEVVDSLRAQRQAWYRFVPALLAVGNILVCATIEGAIASASLQCVIFLLVEAILASLPAITLTIAMAGKILDRATVFPLPSSERMRFLLVALFRQPELRAIVFSGMFSAAILSQSRFIGMLLAAAITGLFLASIACVASISVQAARRSTRPEISVASVLVLVTLAVIVGSLVFDARFLLTDIPPLSIVASGLDNVRAGKAGEILAGLLISPVIAGIVLWWGHKRV